MSHDSANPDQVHLEIDGVVCTARKGEMLIAVADRLGIPIPRFCYHEQLSIAANCRMCLVEVEKAPKPLPACATPVMEGMKVSTRSPKAVDAQKGTMEFLLINHPLDCPICDQGGECQLQDLAVGYGGDVSRFAEKKRIVLDKNIGPLIATDMTRCIHCTRCVRFGEEVAGMMELGATGRGEDMRIGLYVEGTVDSELSGNMIDLCPVGALTSKPFRFAARSWELTHQPSVSPHDCIGSNLDVQARRGQVMRVLPRDNAAVNECWLSDRDRFSYTSLNLPTRLTRPLIRDPRDNGVLRETDWNTALAAAAQELKRVSGDDLAALIAPGCTLEEHYLFQKLARGLGSNNVDHRLRERDLRDDGVASSWPGLGQTLTGVEQCRTILLIGAYPRKDQPMLGHRIRRAVRHGAQVLVIDDGLRPFNHPVHARTVVTSPQAVAALAAVLTRVCGHMGRTLPEGLAMTGASAGVPVGAMAPLLDSMATTLTNAAGSNDAPIAILLGLDAMQHADAAVLRALGRHLAAITGARLGMLVPGNGAGAWLAGSVPHRGANGEVVERPGKDARRMISGVRGAFMLMNVEPELDCPEGSAALDAISRAGFVLSLSSFRDMAVHDHAHIVLPLAAYTETDGCFVNCEGRAQAFEAIVPPPGEARPGWKILRVLGNQLGLAGFGQNTAAEVRSALRLPQPGDLLPAGPSSNAAPGRIPEMTGNMPETADSAWRAAPTPYQVDPFVRRALPLQKTDDPSGPHRAEPRSASHARSETTHA